MVMLPKAWHKGMSQMLLPSEMANCPTDLPEGCRWTDIPRQTSRGEEHVGRSQVELAPRNEWDNSPNPKQTFTVYLVWGVEKYPLVVSLMATVIWSETTKLEDLYRLAPQFLAPTFYKFGLRPEATRQPTTQGPLARCPILRKESRCQGLPFAPFGQI